MKLFCRINHSNCSTDVCSVRCLVSFRLTVRVDTFADISALRDCSVAQAILSCKFLICHYIRSNFGVVCLRCACDLHTRVLNISYMMILFPSGAEAYGKVPTSKPKKSK